MPMLKHFRCVIRHDLGIRFNPLVMESGLRELALAFVRGPVGNNNAISQKRMKDFGRHSVLVELTCFIFKHLPNVIWMVEQISVIGSQTEVDNITVGVGGVRQKREIIFAKSLGTPKHDVSAWPW